MSLKCIISFVLKQWKPMLSYASVESQNQFFWEGISQLIIIFFHILFLSHPSHLSKLILSHILSVREELVLNLYQVLVIHGEIQIIGTVWTLPYRNIQPGCRTRYIHIKQQKDNPKAIVNKHKVRCFLLLNYIFMLSLQFCSTILLFHSEFTEILNEIAKNSIPQRHI